MHLVGWVIIIYYDVRTYESQKYIVICKVWLNIFIFLKASFPLVPCEMSLLATTGIIAFVIKILFEEFSLMREDGAVSYWLANSLVGRHF